MSTNLDQKRRGFDTLGQNYPPAADINLTKDSIAGVDCFWFHTIENNPGENIIVYIHGGCFCLGTINSHKSLVSYLAKSTNKSILFIDYALAPERPYPAGVMDVVNVLNELTRSKPLTKFCLMGDSAGGGLIISAFSKLDNKTKVKAESMVLLSPWVDLACDTSSYQSKAAVDPILSQTGMKGFAQLYLGHDSVDGINPANEIDDTFPPMLILVGSNEVLFDDAQIAHQQIVKYQPISRLSVYQDQTHVWPMDNIKSKATQNAFDEINRFLNQSPETILY